MRPRVPAAALGAAGLPVLAAVATAVLFTPFARRGIEPHHDGLVLKTALDVLAGGTPFRDTFCQYGAGIPYLQAATLALGGERLLVLRLATVGAYALAAALLADAWRRLLPPALALLAVAIWLVLPGFYTPGFGFQAWPSAWALPFQALALDALLYALLGGAAAASAGVVCGVACLLVLLCRQPLGIVTTIAVVLALAVAAWRDPDPTRPRRALVACITTIALLLAAAAAALAAGGILGAWYQQTIVWPRAWALGGSRPLVPRLLDALVLAPRLTLPWTAWTVAALFAIRLSRPGARRRPLLVAALALAAAALLLPSALRPGVTIFWTLAIPMALVALAAVTGARILAGSTSRHELAVLGAAAVGIASWHQYFPIPCPQHTFWAVTPAVGVAVYAAWRASGGRTRATAAVLALAMLPVLAGRAPGIRRQLAAPWTRLDHAGVLDGVLVPAGDAAEWRALVAAVEAEVRRRPDVPMLVEGRDALYAALVRDRRNPGPFFVTWAGLAQTFASDAARMRFLATTRPLVWVQHAVRPSLQAALRAEGYREIFRGRRGRLLAPRSGRAGAARPLDVEKPIH